MTIRATSLAVLALAIGFTTGFVPQSAPPVRPIGPMRPIVPVVQQTKSAISQVGFDQKLGETLPRDLPFQDESGREIRLGDLLGRRPVIIAPVYYRCPMLCNQLLTGLARSLKPVSLDPGKDFDVVAFSINPDEPAALAGPKKAALLDEYDRRGTSAGWHFLTGDETSIAALARTVGFRYTYNPQTKLFAHATGVVIVTPDGRISRYFYGIEFPPKDLKLELERARAGRLGNPIGRLLLLCYDYDSASGKYTLSILRVLRVLGTATALALGGFLFVMFRRDWKSRHSQFRTEPLTE
jgi:protein SCO1/2